MILMTWTYFYSSSKRPDRLISKLKCMNLEDGKRVVTIRAPKGPDGSKGFKAPRNVVSQGWGETKHAEEVNSSEEAEERATNDEQISRNAS